MSEFNCRLCSERTRCIEQSHNASSVKSMMYHSFEIRTDTLATWRRLQRDCLIVKAEQPNISEDTEIPALSKRLRQVHAEKNGNQLTDASNFFARTSGFVGVEELDSRHSRHSQQSRSNSKTVSRLKRKHLTNFLRLPSGDPIDASSRHWLTIEGTWRHIALPIDGSLVLGRFDPNFGMAPDIDLAYEDHQNQLISRRHMAIVGERGKHTVEDLGSLSGVLLNDEKIGIRSSRPLQNGDRIKLGAIRLIYDRIPALVFSTLNQNWVRHTLTVTATGHKHILTPSGSVTIGRADPWLNSVPEIDLNSCGQVAQRVSRRHARIIWQNGKPFVEDIGSGFGTRLHGTLLPLGETKPLLPGDHIWLAGCVLAYDIEVPEQPEVIKKRTNQIFHSQALQMEQVQLPA